MPPSIRGHQTSVKVLKNGQAVALQAVKNFEANQDSSFSRSEYVGQALTEGDQAFQGWSGSFEMDVKDSATDDLLDAITTNNLNGIGGDELTIVDTETYVNGVVRAWVYFDIQMKMNKRTAGLSEKVTKRIEWQSAGRMPL